jgi:hypothetical protein
MINCILSYDETGIVKFVDGSALASLFELFANQVECVFLNACYSKYQFFSERLV